MNMKNKENASDPPIFETDEPDRRYCVVDIPIQP